MIIETCNPVVRHEVAAERDMISPDLLADIVREGADLMLTTTPGALNWETFGVAIEPREQPATAPRRSTYVNVVLTAELL